MRSLPRKYEGVLVSAVLGILLSGCGADCPAGYAVVEDRRSTRALCVGEGAESWTVSGETTAGDASGMGGTTSLSSGVPMNTTGSTGGAELTGTVGELSGTMGAEASSTTFDSACGNGVLDEGEACDDGNSDDHDACLSNCEQATCGDGVLWVGQELCDDGNADNDDACPSTCIDAHCGDGFLYAGVEVCDDGNVVLGDGCSAVCEREYIMFVTTGVYDGAFGSLMVADALCQGEAEMAGLGGTYAAWLWRGFDGPDDMLASGERLVRRDGVMIVADADELLQVDTLSAPVNLDAMAELVTGMAWTGSWGVLTCEEWTSSEATAKGSFGDTGQVGPEWTLYGQSTCNVPRHLYCFRRKDD